MTTPYLRTRALVQAKELLRALADPATTSEALENLRARATEVLRHYPSLAELQTMHEAAPELMGPPPPFSRLSGSQYVVGVIAVTVPPDPEGA